MILLLRKSVLKHCLFNSFFVLCLYSQTIYATEFNTEILRFVVPDFPPYSYLKNGQAQGIAIEKVTKVLALAKIKYQIKVVKDYKIALLLMKMGKADGFFLATENTERNNIATFTKPLMVNRWCWYFKADSGLTPLKRRFKRVADIGTILNTNTHKWLKKNKYRVRGKPDNATALNKMLLADRVDAVFVAEAVFEMVIPAEQYYLYHKKIEFEKPFGIYISNQYITKNQTIIEQLNKAIAQQ
jgi:polar amino acid transport system substrate-binding protein